jgi:hypothetical protein
MSRGGRKWLTGIKNVLVQCLHFQLELNTLGVLRVPTDKNLTRSGESEGHANDPALPSRLPLIGITKHFSHRSAEMCRSPVVHNYATANNFWAAPRTLCEELCDKLTPEIVQMF